MPQLSDKRLEEANDSPLVPSFSILLKLYIHLFPALIAPFIGAYLAQYSKHAFDVFEISSFLFLPILYLTVGHYFGSRRLLQIDNVSVHPIYVRYKRGYMVTFYTALWILVFYQSSITIILSPGGPEGAEDLFWTWFMVFYVPYLVLIATSEYCVIEARRALRTAVSDSNQ